MQNNAGQLLARVRAGRDEALDAMGRTAAALVRVQLLTGYGRPIRQSGALLADVQWARDGDRVQVGNTLPYAAVIHNGARHMPGRPYLADALAGGTAALTEAAGEALKSIVR